MKGVADESINLDYAHSLCVTDLYQLNMVEAYLAGGMTGEAVFEFFVRRMPPTRTFLMAAGLEQAVRHVLGARIGEAEARWLRDCGRFSDRCVNFLESFSFTGDVDAVPEGTLVFSDEPILRVRAPIHEGQLLETRLVNFLNYQTIVATKAARMVLAAPGKALVDFGLRRAHSGEAGVLAARAAYLAGFAGTATVPAERLFGVPLYGTVAHSYVQAHGSEEGAFLDFGRARPDQTIFLIDTYDTETAARKVVDVARILKQEGIETRGVRIDSGDLAEHAARVRRILDEAGLTEARIVASGGIDEFELAALTRQGAPIDAYGVGTSLVTSDDQPDLDCAYKLKEYAGVATRKRSEGKAYWPGPTEVYRRHDDSGHAAGDVITTPDDEEPAARGDRRLLRPVVRNGELVAPLPSLDAAREHAASELATLPRNLGTLSGDGASYPVTVSERLRALADRVDRQQRPGKD